MESIALPAELESFVGSENKDFVVKAGRVQPLAKSLMLVILGIIWSGFISVFVIGFFGPLFLGQAVHFETNGVPTVASPGNLGPIIFPAIIIGIFVLIGVGMFSRGIYMVFKKGGYYVGTPTRLIQFQNGKVRSIDWEQFSGDIEVRGNAQKGDVSLQMRTGVMVNRKNGSDKYVPDVVYISGIQNVFEVEQICRKRIKENDPTPAAA